MSLLSNDSVSAVIDLAETGDLDALLRTEYVVQKELRSILQDFGMIYDESSGDIWIPKDAKFEPLFDLKNIEVLRIDAESALISKAVKAPEKNRILIQDALASGHFPGLADKIKKYGGNLDYFIGETE